MSITVLYIDDEPELLEIGKLFLEESNDIFVTTADSATDALDLLQNKKFDAIISDYQMPLMDGITFLKMLRQRGDTTPFIIFTGRGREEIVIEALNSGADFYLQKGGEFKSLFTELSHKVVHAITSRKAIHELKNSELKYRQLIENANEAIFVVQDEIIRIINPRSVELTGYSEQEILEQPFIRFVHPDDHLMLIERYKQRIRGENIPSHYTFRVFRKDGTVMWGELSAVVITWDGHPATLNFLTDVTERKLVEDSLKESETRYREFFKSIQDSVYITSSDGEWIDFNDSTIELFGYETAEELFKVRISSLFANPDELSVFTELLDANSHIKEYPLHLKQKDGTIIDTLTTTVPVLNPDGSIKMLIGTIRDITKQKRAEEALRESEERLRTILFSLQYGIIIIDAHTHEILDANPKVLELIGGEKESVIGAVCHRFICPAEIGRCPVMDLGLPVDSSERVLYTLKGEKVPIIKSVIKTTLAGKDVLVESFIDITDRKRVDEALRQANRQLTLLSGITRHDIKNQISILEGLITIIKKRQSDSTLDEYFAKISNSALRISSMIQFTKEFEEIGVNIPLWQDCRSLVDNAAKEIIHTDILLKNDLPEGSEVFADPLIVKVFYNLIDNAVRYSGNTPIIRFFLEDQNSNHVLICEDKGDGVPEEEKEKIFERGFGKNTGLGLFLSREILTITGITICETGKPWSGARFEITIPDSMWRYRGN